MIDCTVLLAMSPRFCGLPPSGPDFRYTNFSGGRVFAFYLHTLFGLPSPSHFTRIPTQTFQVAVTVAGAFYLHIFFGWSGFCLLPTQTFRVAVTVASAFKRHKLFGWPGFCILPTYTFGAILMQN